jgi:hypothetical protein
VARSLGRNLSGGAANTTVGIVGAGHDVLGAVESDATAAGQDPPVWRRARHRSVDIYNVFNSNTVPTLNKAFATWQRPQSIPYPRWAKVPIQNDPNGSNDPNDLALHFLM